MMVNLWKSVFIALAGVFFSLLSVTVFADVVGALNSEEQRQAVCETATEAQGKEVSREINIAETVANCVGSDSTDEKTPKVRRSSGSGEAAQ